MARQSKFEETNGSMFEGPDGLKEIDPKQQEEAEDLEDEIDEKFEVSENIIASGLVEATRIISTVLSVGIPMLAMRGKPTLKCPHPKINLITEKNDGVDKAKTSRKGQKPKISKKDAEDLAQEKAEKKAKDKAEGDLKQQQNSIQCADGCKKIRGKIKTELSMKGETTDEVENKDGTFTFTAKATAKGSTTILCKKK